MNRNVGENLTLGGPFAFAIDARSARRRKRLLLCTGTRTNGTRLAPGTLRARYRDALRAALTPICERPNRREDLLRLLASDVDVIWHVSRTRDKNEELHVETAPHRIWYSARPLFEIARARRAVEDGRDRMFYQPTDDDTVIHRVAPGPAFESLRTMYLYWAGRETRRHWGILHGGAYLESVALAGNEPVYEQAPATKFLKAAYKKDDNWRYQPVHPRELRRLIVPTHLEKSYAAVGRHARMSPRRVLAATLLAFAASGALAWIRPQGYDAPSWSFHFLIGVIAIASGAWTALILPFAAARLRWRGAQIATAFLPVFAIARGG